MRRIIIATIALTLTAAGYLYGFASHRNKLFPAEQVGRLARVLNVAPVPKSARLARQTERTGALQTLGYADGVREATDEGVLIRIEEEMAPGYTLICSKHNSSAKLIDARGSVQHEWKLAPEDVWPDVDWVDRFGSEGHWAFSGDDWPKGIRRAWVDPQTADLIALYEYAGIAKVNASGEVIWRCLERNHHDFDVLPDGRVLSLAATPRSRQDLEASGLNLNGFPTGIVDDVIVVLDKNGNISKKISILDALASSASASLIARSLDQLGALAKDQREQDGIEYFDLLHTNSIRLLPSEWANIQNEHSGEVALVSIRNLNLLAAIDLEHGVALWSDEGPWLYQHQAQPLLNGNILLLDNCGESLTGSLNRDNSRVLEWDPRRRKIRWQFPANSGQKLQTQTQGFCEELPNGNVLITESSGGRIVEVERQGRLVWEYINPFRSSTDPRLVAVLNGARRVEITEYALQGLLQTSKATADEAKQEE